MVGAGAELRLQRTDRAAARGGKALAGRRTRSGRVGCGGAFGSVAAPGALPLLGATHLAVRAGGERVLGEYPVFESAFLGGRTSLRGHRYQRFAGDASAFGSVELRVPIDTVRLLLNGELGVFGLADAGRVWLEGDSPGGWHTAAGGGIWFATMGSAVSLTWARGEQNRFYLWLGLPY
jgi:outer membrane translocation and assembly module TamA